MEDIDWKRKASNLLKAELARSGVAYDELIKRLAALGVDETYTSVSSKINRGTFSMLFFMQCMKALHKSSVRLDDD